MTTTEAPPAEQPKPEEQYSEGGYAVCPWCKHDHGDCDEWVHPSLETETDCDGCGKPFTVLAEFSVTYYSYVTGREVPAKLPKEAAE